MTGDAFVEFRKVLVRHILFIVVFMGLFGAAYHFSKHVHFEPDQSNITTPSVNGTEEDRGFAYCIFGAIAGSVHFILFLLAFTFIRQIDGTKEEQEKSPGTLGIYVFFNFIFILYCFGASIGCGVLGICGDMETCKYQEYQTENLAMAICITAFLALSLIHSAAMHSKAFDTQKVIKARINPAPPPAPKKTEEQKKTGEQRKAEEQKKAGEQKKAEVKNKTEVPKKAGEQMKAEVKKKPEGKKQPEEKNAEHNTRTDTSNKTIATISGAVAPRRRLKPKAKQQESKMNTSSSSEDDFVVDVDYLPMGKTGQTRTDIFQTQRVPENEFRQKSSHDNDLDNTQVSPQAPLAPPPSYDSVYGSLSRAPLEPVALDQTSRQSGWVPGSELDTSTEYNYDVSRNYMRSTSGLPPNPEIVVARPKSVL